MRAMLALVVLVLACGAPLGGGEPAMLGVRGYLARAERLASQSSSKRAAAEVYREGLRAHPRSPELLFNLALTLQEIGELAQSAQAYEQVLSLLPLSDAPRRAQVSRNLGVVLLSQATRLERTLRGMGEHVLANNPPVTCASGGDSSSACEMARGMRLAAAASLQRLVEAGPAAVMSTPSRAPSGVSAALLRDASRAALLAGDPARAASLLRNALREVSHNGTITIGAGQPASAWVGELLVASDAASASRPSPSTRSSTVNPAMVLAAQSIAIRSSSSSSESHDVCAVPRSRLDGLAAAACNLMTACTLVADEIASIGESAPFPPVLVELSPEAALEAAAQCTLRASLAGAVLALRALAALPSPRHSSSSRALNAAYFAGRAVSAQGAAPEEHVRALYDAVVSEGGWAWPDQRPSVVTRLTSDSSSRGAAERHVVEVHADANRHEPMGFPLLPPSWLWSEAFPGRCQVNANCGVGGVDWQRLASSVATHHGETARQQVSVLQQLLVDLEHHASAIREEAMALLHVPPSGTASGFVLDNLGLAASGQWRQLILARNGKPNPAALDRLPHTASVLNSTLWAAGRPGHHLPQGVAEVSVMMPGTRIRPHCAPNNHRWRVHLALEAPPGAQILMWPGPQVAQWRTGRTMLLDDSFEHAVDASTLREPRVVLILDVWHPALLASPADSQAVRRAHHWTSHGTALDEDAVLLG